VIEERVRQRRSNFDFYQKELKDLPGISFQDELKHSFSNRWLSCILIDPELSNGLDRESIRLALEKENIESRPLWKPLHLQPVFKGVSCFGGNVSERLFEMGLCLPSGSNLSNEELSRIIHSIRGK